jgi:hypothetical protein
MHSLAADYAAGLLDGQGTPCLSIYQPTHRHHPENQQDPIRFKNLLKAMGASLREKYAPREAQPLLAPFQALAQDSRFWNHTLDGLAVLGAPDFFRVYRLQRTVRELVIVAESFHLKPLLRILQSADRYQVLGLSLNRLRLYEGNRDVLDEVEPAAGVPRTIEDALGEELTDPHHTVASYGTGTRGPGMHHGHGSRKDEIDVDAERFFRVVDRAVLEHHSRPSGLPLILAALPEHHALYHRLSHNPFLMPEAIDIHPDAIPLEALRDRAWRVVEPRYLARLRALIEEFGSAKPKGLAGDDPAQVAEATAAGRVATLLVEADRQIPGRLDGTSGRIARDDLHLPDVDDLLDDLAELVLKRGGTVVVVTADRMPTSTGLAAIYRF